jgi:peptidoglycan/LPS O-acetylase OafA/YrhL
VIQPTYEEYERRRYVPSLDGLRAISILLVITVHTTDPMWNPLHGAVGVTIFFVISGYLITTLLIREEKRSGHARIKAFYIRRAFRILPLYYVTLLAYIVLIGVMHLQAGASSVWQSLPWYLSYQNDLAPNAAGIFGQSWSLAIEEKYYLLWPLVFVVPALLRRRLGVAAALAALTALAALDHRTSYFAIYTPILLGCLIAVVMENPRLHRYARLLANTPVALALIAAAAVWDVTRENGSDVHIVFSLLVALLFPAVLIGPRWLSAVLGNPVMVYIGKRSYAVYLIHRIAKGVVDRVVKPGSTSVPHELLHFALIVVLSLIAAEILYRLVEHPLIEVGRRLSSERRGPGRHAAGRHASGRHASEHRAEPAQTTAGDR